MLLLEKLKEFDRQCQQVLALKKELEESLNAQNIQELLGSSFEALSSALKTQNKKEIQNTLSNERKALRQSNQEELKSLFGENLQNISESLSTKTNLQEISKRVAQNLESKNQKQIIKLLREALEGEKYHSTIAQHASSVKKQIDESFDALNENLLLKSKTLSELDPKEELQSLTQEFLQTHKQEVFASANFGFLKSLILEDKNLAKEIQSIVKQTTTQTAKSLAKAQLKQAEAQVNKITHTQILEVLGDKMPKILTEQIPQIGYLRFQGALHCQALALQSQIASITQSLRNLKAQQSAKLGIYHNTLKVH